MTAGAIFEHFDNFRTTFIINDKTNESKLALTSIDLRIKLHINCTCCAHHDELRFSNGLSGQTVLDRYN